MKRPRPIEVGTYVGSIGVPFIDQVPHLSTQLDSIELVLYLHEVHDLCASDSDF